MNNFFALVSLCFTLDFVKRAFIVGILVSLCAALLGVTLTLKRYAMIGDGLSHVGFATLSVAAVLNLSNSLIISIPVVIVAAFLLLRLNESGKIKGDSAIAIISTSAIAVGYVISYRLPGSSGKDVCSYMFGSLLTISKADLLPCIILSAVVIITFILLYNRIFAITFDRDFSHATGVPTRIYNDLLALLTAVTIVLGMKIMGTLLISALVVFPALTSKTVCKSFKGMIILSAAVSVVCCVLGIIAGAVFDTPAGSTVVIFNLLAFILFACGSRILKKS